MPSVFTRRQSSRFLDQDAALAALRACAKHLADACNAVMNVHLFGSLATGRATPRSDADIVIEVSSPDAEERVYDLALRFFSEAPLPVDLFVRSSEALAFGGGIADAVAREGQRLV